MQASLTKNKIARRLVLYILACSSVITLFLTAYQLYRNYQTDLDTIEVRIQQIGLSDVRAISASFWVFDIKSIAIQLEGLASLPDMQYLAVLDPHGKDVAHSGTPADEDIIEVAFPLDHIHREEHLNLGTLVVQASLKGVYQRLIDEALLILATQATKTFIVSIFIFFIVQHVVTRHLETIARHTEALDLEKENPPLVLHRQRKGWAKHDELERVVDAINTMERKLWSTYKLLLQHRDHLDEMVRERTWELEQANKELTSFCYTVSHDLRAPLRSINGFSDALIESYSGDLSAEGRDYLQRVKVSAVRMGELIDDLLNLSRVTQSEIFLTDVDMTRLAREAAQQLKQTHPDHAIEVDIQAGMHVTGDTRLLRIALDNLLSNAWKYTSKVASPKVSVGMTEKDGRKHFFVKDNGAGFDPDYQHKLFTPFQRLHPSTEFAGTGIGLATVERIITRHKGRIWAEGRVNEGATFHFSLPDIPVPDRR